ncbi:MAG: GNAT family N-acetyltransferase [Candidatus Latescibacteria bacterium]|nr:GNAT family N-acetyltransferase [Candidatus Latescibacterota bacterium]MBT4137432.1 GNAT family N-acetyltransferase [Candidatus Latescibacterota bacterium]MBT5831799.1 GNAT family N-acetyltransferase [Candidatus Latescibacterota bacterium]
MEYQVFHLGGYEISTDPTRLDIHAIHQYLTRSYWAKGILRDKVAKSLQALLCFGVYQANMQIGFARVVSDYTTFAYLCDVYMLEDHRRKGLGKWLIQTVIDYPNLQGLRRFQLATKDAHGLYKQFGFQPLFKPENQMVKRQK